jgi:hypothetical protein
LGHGGSDSERQECANQFVLTLRRDDRGLRIRVDQIVRHQHHFGQTAGKGSIVTLVVTVG